MKVANLSQLKLNKPAVIEELSKDVKDNANLARHLNDLGFIKGNSISVTNKINQDMFIVKVGNNNPMAIDKNIINKISVSANDEFISSAKKQNKKMSLPARIKEWFLSFLG